MNSEKSFIVQTQYGPVKGHKTSTFLGQDVIEFLGIPYMKAAAGKLRFRAPQPPDYWTEPFDATQSCPSFPVFDFMTSLATGIEDGGRINVFTKNLKPTKLYPVMAFIHGGGFQYGSSSPDLLGPDYILQKDVIYVSFNYRIGTYGFLSLDDKSLDVPGNAGLKDQSMALKWIQGNIEKFGGDKNNVTLFGTSAGGASVCYQLISNQSRNLFKRAISMSGTPFNSNWALHERFNNAQRIATALGYEGDNSDKSILEFLEAADMNRIIEVSENISTDEEKYLKKVSCPMGPCIEPYITSHTFIPKHPVLMAREAWSKDIDVIYGGTSNEGLVSNPSVKKDVKLLEALAENSACFTPFVDLNLKITDEKAIKYGEKLKQMYYGSTQPSPTNKEGYFYYISDSQFWHGISRIVKSRQRHGGRGKTFLYRFDIVTELNSFLRKVFYDCDEFPGCEHGGCTCYIFFTKVIPPTFSLNSKGFECLKRVINILARFAIDGTVDEEWKAIDKNESALKCYDIRVDGCHYIDLPETKRLYFWDKMYEDIGVDLY